MYLFKERQSSAHSGTIHGAASKKEDENTVHLTEEQSVVERTDTRPVEREGQVPEAAVRSVGHTSRDGEITA